MSKSPKLSIVQMSVWISMQINYSSSSPVILLYSMNHILPHVASVNIMGSDEAENISQNLQIASLKLCEAMTCWEKMVSG